MIFTHCLSPVSKSILLPPTPFQNSSTNACYPKTKSNSKQSSSNPYISTTYYSTNRTDKISRSALLSTCFSTINLAPISSTCFRKISRNLMIRKCLALFRKKIIKRRCLEIRLLRVYRGRFLPLIGIRNRGETISSRKRIRKNKSNTNK